MKSKCLVIGIIVEMSEPLRSCRWKACLIDGAPKQLLIQHLAHHRYISRLVSIGQNLVVEKGLTECKRARISTMPSSYEKYQCYWKDCHDIFGVTIYDFLSNLVEHVESSMRDSKHKKFECRWKECQTKYPSRVKLAEHMRTHSGDEVLACPTCFGSFSNATRFGDHRSRQQDITKDSLSCMQCGKLFQNERLLGAHSRSHTITQRSRGRMENLEPAREFDFDIHDSKNLLLTPEEESELFDQLGGDFDEISRSMNLEIYCFQLRKSRSNWKVYSSKIAVESYCSTRRCPRVVKIVQ